MAVGVDVSMFSDDTWTSWLLSAFPSLPETQPVRFLHTVLAHAEASGHLERVAVRVCVLVQIGALVDIGVGVGRLD